MSKWTLFSNHGHVLVVLSRDPDARLRDVAQIVGITERAVQKIVRDLQDGGMVSVTKQGRRNSYHLHPNQPLRHSLEAHCTTGELLEMINRRAPGTLGVEPEPAPEAVSPQQPQPIPEAPPAGPPSPVETPPRVESDEEGPARRPTSSEPVDGGDQGSLF